MYVTMSHWEASEMTDEMIETMQTKFIAYDQVTWC